MKILVSMDRCGGFFFVCGQVKSKYITFGNWILWIYRTPKKIDRENKNAYIKVV